MKKSFHSDSMYFVFLELTWIERMKLNRQFIQIKSPQKFWFHRLNIIDEIVAQQRRKNIFKCFMIYYSQINNFWQFHFISNVKKYSIKYFFFPWRFYAALLNSFEWERNFFLRTWCNKILSSHATIYFKILFLRMHVCALFISCFFCFFFIW